MKKMKVVSIIIVTILIGAGVTSISVAQPLDGEIDVEIREILGLVAPVINLKNESNVTFVAESSGDENETYYRVNDTLEISLDVTDNSGKESYIFPRPVFYTAVIFRKPKITLKGGFFKRMLPTFEILKSVNVVNASLGKNQTDFIQLKVNYSVADISGTEQMTLHLLCFGIPPGDANGIEGIHVVDYKKVTLNVDYVPVSPI